MFVLTPAAAVGLDDALISVLSWRLCFPITLLLVDILHMYSNLPQVLSWIQKSISFTYYVHWSWKIRWQLCDNGLGVCKISNSKSDMIVLFRWQSAFHLGPIGFCSKKRQPSAPVCFVMEKMIYLYCFVHWLHCAVEQKRFKDCD